MTSPNGLTFLSSGGEAGSIIQDFNWTETSVGPMEAWSHSLKVALQILLSSRFPMQILWGSDYIQFYNDAYIPIAGDKHPTGIGQRAADCWQEIWDFSGAFLDQVMTTGEATWSENQPLLLNRNGQAEQGYFTFSYTPIWEDEGQVGGIFIVVNETTQQVLGQQRERTLRAEAQAITENLENVLTSISDEFMMFDSSWCFTYVNDRAVNALQKSRQDLLGASIWDVFPELIASPFYRQLHQAVESQTATSFDLFCDMEHRWLENRVYPFDNGVSLLRVDITGRKNLERALYISEDQLTSILNTAPASIARCRFFADRTYRLDYRSVGCETLTGYTLEDITPELWVARTFAEDWAVIAEPMFDAVFQQQPITVEYRFRHKDGSIRWIADSLTSRWDETDNCWIVMMVGIDITARKQAEDALRRSEDHLSMAQRVAQFGSWEFYPDHKKSVWSKAMFDQFGFDPDQTEPDYDELMQRIHPGDRGIFEQSVHQDVTGKKAYAIDLRVLLANGTIRYLHSRCEPVLDSQNQVVKLMGTCLDITERKQIEMALQDSEARYRVLAESMPQMVWLADCNGVQYWNQRWYEYTGLGQAESLAIGGINAVHPDDQERTFTLWQHAIEAGEGFDIEQRIRRHDGVYRWFLNRGLPIQDRSGEVTRWVGTITDVDDKKQLEAERARLFEQERVARAAAESANRIKDEFLAVLSHELRSPLNPILGWARLLRTTQLNATKTEHALETIERNAKLQAQLIDDLLDVSRILRGKLVLTPAPVSLASVIEEALETVYSASEAKNIHIQTQLDLSPIRVSGDANRLKQVVWNLLSNAVKFTPNGGEVTVQLHYSDHWAEVQVADTGKGIDTDFLPYVFDRFRQADSTTTRLFGGLGLGLAIADQIVAMHGGVIQAESPGIDQGATFTVRLPVLSKKSLPQASINILQNQWNLIDSSKLSSP